MTKADLMRLFDEYSENLYDILGDGAGLCISYGSFNEVADRILLGDVPNDEELTLKEEVAQKELEEKLKNNTLYGLNCIGVNGVTHYRTCPEIKKDE